jgi:hypothetical protein
MITLLGLTVNNEPLQLRGVSMLPINWKDYENLAVTAVAQGCCPRSAPVMRRGCAMARDPMTRNPLYWGLYRSSPYMSKNSLSCPPCLSCTCPNHHNRALTLSSPSSSDLAHAAPYDTALSLPLLPQPHHQRPKLLNSLSISLMRFRDQLSLCHWYSTL